MKILFVCLGNICRSPIAEGVLKQLCKHNGLNDWHIDSASTNTYHTGEPPHHLSQKICRNHNIDISQQRARRLKKEDIERYDIIWVMAEDVMQDVKHLLGAHFDSSKVLYFMDVFPNKSTRNVPDPWYGGEEDFITTFRIIYEGCEHIIQQKNKFIP